MTNRCHPSGVRGRVKAERRGKGQDRRRCVTLCNHGTYKRPSATLSLRTTVRWDMGGGIGCSVVGMPESKLEPLPILHPLP